MASNIYAKSYKMESRARKTDEYAFISYLDDSNTFSIVAVKRLIDVDQFRKGSIREKNKIYRISVEQTGNCVKYLFKNFLLFKVLKLKWRIWQWKQNKVVLIQ